MSTSDFVQITRRDKFSEEDFYPMVNSMYEHLWRNLLPPQLVTEGLSNRVQNNVVTPPDAPVPDCMSCGACCQSFICVTTRPSDHIDSGMYWNITIQGESGEIVVDRYVRRNGETLACAALEGTIGEKVACQIYEARPTMCRHFEAGSDRCHAIRRAYGIEPFLTLDEMSDALEKLDAQPVKADPSQIVRNAQIKEDAETGRFTINVLMKDGTMRNLHTYDRESETWMQFEFEGLLLAEARELINSRKNTSDGPT